ncbi:MAG: chemotaxis protein CheX [Phycisphaerae bacterium]
MDVRYINPFVMAIRNVFSTMLKVEVAVDKPRVKKDEAPYSDVSAIIGYSGDAAGTVILSFDRTVAEKLASTFVGQPVQIDQVDCADALGELANMVAGNAKSLFDGLDVKISLPSVIVGQGHHVSQSNLTPTLIIPCSCSMGTFFVEIGMKVSKALAGAPAPAAAAQR